MIDTAGNTIVQRSITKDVMRYDLKLVKEKHMRELGAVRSGTFFVVRDRKEHLMRINNSYGFCDALLRMNIAHSVQITDETGVYVVPVHYIIENGTYLHFKEMGFEKQIFLRIELMEKFKK